MKELILLKCGELALKGLNRRSFEEVLMKNCRRRLETLGSFKIRSAQSTIYVEPESEEIDIDEAVDRLSRVFGVAALTRAAELGIEIVPATGRFYGGMPDFIRALPFLHYALTINGAQVCAVPNCDPIYRAEIPWQDAVSLLRYLDKWDVTYDCYAENAAWITASMKARGYGLPGRSRFALFRFRAADAALAAVSVLLLGLTLAGTAAGATVFYYYPRISALPLSPFSVAVYAAFGLLSFLPFVIEAKEALVWKYYISKM